MNLKLHEIISLNDKPDTAINTEEIVRYKKSLLTYFRSYYQSEPILMVTDITNRWSFGKIVPSNELLDALTEYLDCDGTMIGEDRKTAEETILFNSRLLSEL